MTPTPSEMLEVLKNLKQEPQTNVFSCSGRVLALTVVINDSYHLRRRYSVANGLDVDELEDQFYNADPEVSKYQHLDWLDLALSFTPNMFDECLQEQH